VTATLTPVRGGNAQAMLRRASALAALEAAAEREAARWIELAREAGATDEQIAAALEASPVGPTEKLERELYRMDGQLRAAQADAGRARSQLAGIQSSRSLSREERDALMRELFAAGELSLAEIGRRVGLCRATVCHYRKRWAAGLMRDADRSTG
jgi:DNA-directed RNA polymerase specialized sigma subunit